MSATIDIEHARFNMVEQQIRTWEVLDPDVLDLLYVVRREEFVPADKRNLAFSDLEIPLGESQRMMAPKVEARIVQELTIRKGDRVLEVGTGSGYLTALLAHRAMHVFSVEINPKLLAFGRRNLARHGAANVTTEQGDAARGWAAHAPYDVIVLTGSTPLLPTTFLDQLKPGGRMFAIVGDPPVMSARLMTCDPGHSMPGSWQGINLFETNFPLLVNALQPERFQF